MQITYALLQALAWALFAGLFGVTFLVGAYLRQQVAAEKMRSDDALQIVNRYSTFVGFILGPTILIILVSIAYMPFGRWYVNTLTAKTLIWQLELQMWLDTQVEDDFSATGLGAVLRSTQLIMASLYPLIGLIFRNVIKATMGAGPYKIRNGRRLSARH